MALNSKIPLRWARQHGHTAVAEVLLSTLLTPLAPCLILHLQRLPITP